jgi:hypothetical protein
VIGGVPARWGDQTIGTQISLDSHARESRHVA